MHEEVHLECRSRKLKLRSVIGVAMSSRKIACIGAGTIGSSWALLFALREHSVLMYDLTEGLLRKARQNIDVMLGALCGRGSEKKQDSSANRHN
jgi:3-hydroxyacyl-CoA dehydrogenase